MHSAIPTIIFLLIALSLFIYIALSSIEYGMAFFQMFPKSGSRLATTAYT